MFLSPPSQSTFTKLTAFGTIVTRLSLPKFCVRRSEYGSTQMTCWAPWFRKNWAVSPFPAPTSRTVPSTPSLGRYTRCHCFNSSFRIFLWGGSSFRFAKSGYSHIVSASYLIDDNRIQCLISAILLRGSICVKIRTFAIAQSFSKFTISYSIQVPAKTSAWLFREIRNVLRPFAVQIRRPQVHTASKKKPRLTTVFFLGPRP